MNKLRTTTTPHYPFPQSTKPVHIDKYGQRFNQPMYVSHMGIKVKGPQST